MKEVIGLDIGTSRLVLARRQGDSYEFDSQLNAFVTIPHSKMTESALRKEGIPYATEAGEIIVTGNESARFADLLQMETRRPMTRGVLNPHEAEGPSRLRQLIQSLLVRDRDASRIYFTVPAPPLGAEETLTYHEATLKQLFGQLGYRSTAINEGLAVIYSELESTNYSGIGVSFGGGLVNVCLAYLSVPVLSFSIPKGGDYIDASAASITGELATRVRLAKEDGFYFNGAPKDKLQQVLGVYYDEMVREVCASLKEAFSNARNIPRLGRAIPIVLAGGSALPRGFRERFETALGGVEFPVKLSEVRLAASPLHASAKGALVAAMADGEEPLAATASA
jgi:hypothetical protein